MRAALDVPMIAVVVAEVALALAGLAGGAALMLDPSGAVIGLGPAALERTPFPDFQVPGFLLLASQGLWPLLAAGAAVTRRDWAQGAAVSVGLLLTGWMGAQIALIGSLIWLQSFWLAYGIVLTGLAVAWTWSSRRPPRR